jgi:hypothetical protein
MNWRYTLSVILLAGAILVSLASCGQAETTVVTQLPTDTQQVSPPNSSLSGTKPLPPSGNFTGERPAGNFTGERPSPPILDMAAAAAKLGVTEAQLTEAMSNSGQGRMDLAAAATKLGVTETALREALGFPDNMTPPDGTPPTVTGTPVAGQ